MVVIYLIAACLAAAALVARRRRHRMRAALVVRARGDVWDSATGLVSATCWHARLDAELARARRVGRPVHGCLITVQHGADPDDQGAMLAQVLPADSVGMRVAFDRFLVVSWYPLEPASFGMLAATVIPIPRMDAGDHVSAAPAPVAA